MANNPYTNEHAARLADPKSFTRFARVNDRGGPGIDFIFGYKNGSSFLQAIRFKSNMWTLREAEKWLKQHYYKPIKIEEATGKIMKNPFSRKEDYNDYIEYFIDEEAKGIREYRKFADLLRKDPKYHRVLFAIRNILEDELKHLEALRMAYDK